MTELKRRPFAILFVVSLALNLFLLGIFAARGFHRHKSCGFEPGPPEPAMSWLQPASRPTAEAIFASRKADIDKRARAARQARDDAAAALGAEPFDPAKASAALADARAKELAMREGIGEALIELATKLPPDQRASLRHALEPGRGGRFGMGPPWGRGPAGRFAPQEPGPRPSSDPSPDL